MNIYTALITAILLASSTVQAEDCATTFPARLADAKRALVEQMDYVANFEASGARAKVEWFEAHCHFLSDLERAVRKLDDPNAFVCDPKAGKRPKGLTAELVIQYSVTPSVGTFQGYHNENAMCLDQDTAARVSLIVPTEITMLEKLTFLCYDDDSERCVKARASIAAARQ